MTQRANQFFGRSDPARDAGYQDPPARKGFFTDTSICIGCKACEVACKEWNAVPEDGLELTGNSYDNSGGLGASTWRTWHSSSSQHSPPCRWACPPPHCPAPTRQPVPQRRFGG